MSDAQSLHSDLAFMRAVADDRGPMPRTIGEHMLVPGLIFGANFVLIWAVQANFLAMPTWFDKFTWAPGAAFYLACYPVLMARSKGAAIGPGARAFAAVWCGVALMTLVSVAVIVAAAISTGRTFHETWPASAFVLYGGAWVTIAIIRKSWSWALVGAGSFVTAIAAALVLLAAGGPT